MFTITECRIHGTRETADFTSALVYVTAATECVIYKEAEDMEGTEAHTDWHLEDGTDCWKCCNLMVIDPHGMFDY